MYYNLHYSVYLDLWHLALCGIFVTLLSTRTDTLRLMWLQHPGDLWATD